MALEQNKNGYGLASRSYVRRLEGHLDLNPVSKSSICEARQKLSWEAFAYLFEKVGKEGGEQMCWKKHKVRAVDGTYIQLPHSEEILKEFPQCGNHYPKALLVTAQNMITGQPVMAQVDSYYASERDLLLSLLDSFNSGDISVLDRGFDGARVWSAFNEKGQFFVSRLKITSTSIPRTLKEFIASGRSQAVIKWKHKSDEEIDLRVVRCGVDRRGLPIVIATNLMDNRKYKAKELWQLYKKRWSIETMYFRLKRLLKVEHMRSKKLNGILQEIWSHLTIVALTSIYVFACGKPPSGFNFGFKAGLEALLRHFNHLLDGTKKIKSYQIVEEIMPYKYKVRPDRKYPRSSKQPRKTWCGGARNTNNERYKSKHRWAKEASSIQKIT